ncbi:hypothetical protein OH460_07650 [Vibrio sp. Makdt]|uniref:hypothetical protein n=1 Tax=Vibrio sp. Makdt TaxID=2998828 RepID=UPI0022CD44C8|nr:hypothetical protein [Vibrio sp. Makdt]MDA0152170.1 hypothetical protein [Vibrio sp. Makdt]
MNKIPLLPLTKKKLSDLCVETRYVYAFGERYEIPKHVNAVDTSSTQGWQLRFSRREYPKFSKYLQRSDKLNRSHTDCIESLSQLIIQKMSSGEQTSSEKLTLTQDKPPINLTLNGAGYLQLSMHLFGYTSKFPKQKTVSAYVGNQEDGMQDRLNRANIALAGLWEWRRQKTKEVGITRARSLQLPDDWSAFYSSKASLPTFSKEAALQLLSETKQPEKANTD